MMLSKMIKMNSLNGEGVMVGPNEEGQIRMNNVCTKIIGMGSVNVIWQIQNSGSKLQLFFSLFLHKKN